MSDKRRMERDLNALAWKGGPPNYANEGGGCLFGVVFVLASITLPWALPMGIMWALVKVLDFLTWLGN